MDTSMWKIDEFCRLCAGKVENGLGIFENLEQNWVEMINCNLPIQVIFESFFEPFGEFFFELGRFLESWKVPEFEILTKFYLNNFYALHNVKIWSVKILILKNFKFRAVIKFKKS